MSFPLVTFAAFGDSITLQGTGSYSWVSYAADNIECSWSGGFAQGGARTYQIAAGTVPVVADVTVVMAGTNDVSNAQWAVPIRDSLSAIRDTIVKSEASIAVVSAIAPRNDGFHAEAAAYNTAVRNFVVDMGWSFVDPWTAIRTSDGHYRAGMTTDGIHPTAAAAKIVGHALHFFILAAKRPVYSIG